ncbi:lysozyme inhibitor LprI family protein [Lentibacillus juripiscarius]|uniref:Lysozyme inhibitor LprI family protein n=1 Tax=Lentibacillus juripiscarius TaxID=257446 RepID=A0ABW5VB10_9BACI
MENSPEDMSDTKLQDQEDSSNNDGESLKSSNSNSEMTRGKKGEYLRKLNEMEEADKYAEAKTTTLDMEKQEEERYKKWDEALNEIYGVLKEELSKEEMDKLREEQRNWIKHRDEAAKESSLKYKGGSYESLEYVATQASLTKERCYKLVAHYMK